MIPPFTVLNNAHYPRIIYAHTHAGYTYTNTCMIPPFTVTVRSAHSMASSSTSESDSLPASSACKAQRWYESQSRRLNNSVFSRDLILEGKNGKMACFGGESNGLT